MIYDFEEHTPKIDTDSWVAGNIQLLKSKLKKNSNIWFNSTLGDEEPIVVEGCKHTDGSVIHTDPGCPVGIEKCYYRTSSNVTWLYH